VADLEGRVEVVYVGEHELEVVLLAASAQVVAAAPAREGVVRGIAPALDDLLGEGVPGLEAALDQRASDAGAAELILVPELASAVGAEHQYGIVVLLELGCGGTDVPQAGDVGGAVHRGLAHEPGAGGGQQDDWAFAVLETLDLGRAVLKVEPVGHRAAELTGEHRVLQPGGKRYRCLDRGHGKASTAGIDCCNCGGGGPDHVDRDDRPALHLVAQMTVGATHAHHAAQRTSSGVGARGRNRSCPKASECRPRR
jgi:hypothetical protein